MRIDQFEWDDETIEHLAAHDVAPEEAEEACRLHPYVLRARQGRYIVLGPTGSGRYLTVILVLRGSGWVKVITARAMTQQEHRRYEQR